jgi:hypothetical protein
MRGKAFALLALAPFACVQRGYPLGTTGGVDIRPDIATALYAAPSAPPTDGSALARQSPYQTGVTLALVEGGQPAYSAYVDVRVNPPEALTLASDPAEATPSCALNGDIFRCMATKEGYARFLAASPGMWSGTAKIQVIWGGNDPKELPVTVLPAGLPADATGFSLIVGGLDQADRVLAAFDALTCTTDAVPEDLGSRWPVSPRKPRFRQAYILASAPAATPGILADAPVDVESKSPDAEISLDDTCAVRSPRLRVKLDASGQSSPFYLCFSDGGGTMRFSVTSGVKTIDPPPQIVVDAEPRLIRVRALKTEVEVSALPVDLFEVSAYSADRVRIAVPVDIHVGDDKVLTVGAASIDLADEHSPATLVQAVPLAPGATALHATPRLLTKPDCASPAVNVLPAPTGP